MFEIKDNTLYFDECNTVKLAEKHKTPLFVVSENSIIQKCNTIKASFLNKYINTRAVYASKAFLPLAMCKIIEREGLGLDVVSGGELYTALKADFPKEKIEFSGNNKSFEELSMAVDNEIGRINVDNIHELRLLDSICKDKGKKMKILFRITPGVDSNTHQYISTGSKDSKFGIPLDKNIIYSAIETAIESKYLEFMGFHFHVGSQLLDNKSHLEALESALSLIKYTKVEYNYTISDLNIGGGFGIKYTDKDSAKPLSYYIDPIMDRVEKFCSFNNLHRPQIIIEPGRWIIGESGITLYRIGSIKTIPNIRTYAAIDGGMTDNLRPALYQSEYDGIIANKASMEKKQVVTIAGKCCESSDIIIRDLKTAPIESGDLLAVFCTGAYGYSMASNYNKNLIPGVVLVNNGRDEVIVQRETYDTMLSNEIIPNSLKERMRLCL